MLYRTGVRGATALLVAVLASGCTGTSPTTSPVGTTSVTTAPTVTEAPGPSGEVTAVMLGWPDVDGTDPATGRAVRGIGALKAAFEAAYPDIKLTIMNVPFGSGETGYGPKTEAMVQANEACV